MTGGLLPGDDASGSYHQKNGGTDLAHDQQAVQTFRNRTNWIGGQVIQLILIGVWILGDPLSLRGPLPAGEALTSTEAVFVTAALGIVGITAMTFGWYARVEVSSESVVIRNPLRNVRLRGGIQNVDTETRHVRIRADDHWYRCWGAETSLGMQLWQKNTSSTARLRRALAPHYAPASAVPDIGWRKPTVPEFIVVLFWASLATFSAFHGVNM